MKIIYNHFIPFQGFTAINLFGAVFARQHDPDYLRTRRRWAMWRSEPSAQT